MPAGRLVRAAAVLYAAATVPVVGFQLALALGAPWGSYAMGGVFPGAWPPAWRVAAVVQAALLSSAAFVVISRSGMALPRWSRASRRAAWLVVALGGLSLALNLVTPSARERAIWAPVAFLLLACSLVVASAARKP